MKEFLQPANLLFTSICIVFRSLLMEFLYQTPWPRCLHFYHFGHCLYLNLFVRAGLVPNSCHSPRATLSGLTRNWFHGKSKKYNGDISRMARRSIITVLYIASRWFDWKTHPTTKYIIADQTVWCRQCSAAAIYQPDANSFNISLSRGTFLLRLAQGLPPSFTERSSWFTLPYVKCN